MAYGDILKEVEDKKGKKDPKKDAIVRRLAEKKEKK